MEGDAESTWKMNVKRQLAEAEVLRSIYGAEGEFELNNQEEAILEALSNLNDNDAIPEAFYISFIIHLLSTQMGGHHISVGFSMPRGYPEKEPVRITIKCRGGVTKSEHDAINLGAREVAHELVGQEAVLQVLQRVQGHCKWVKNLNNLFSRLKEIVEAKNNESIAKLSEKVDASISNVRGVLHIKRVVIWFHHIKSLQKRKSILEWSKELNLGGYCKPGFPGIIVVEGEKCDVERYVKQLQNLRWQAMSVRGEEVQSGKAIDDMRHFSNGVKELDEHAMSELGCLCREANLEHLFLCALKISR